MGNVPVRRLEASASFDAAKARIGHLEELEFWDSSYSERIAAAFKDDSKISASFGVPARVDALVGKRFLKMPDPF
jgi:hypothetical protein